MSKFDFSQVALDLENFSKGRMSKEDFAAKYYYILDENTDLDKLELLARNPYKLSAWFLKTLEGSRNSVSRDKLASSTIKLILENNLDSIEEDSDYKELFDLNRYKTVIDYENEDGETEKQVLFLQDEKTLKSLIKNILLSTFRISEELFKRQFENIEADLSSLKEQTQQMKTLLELNPHKIAQKSADRVYFDTQITKYIAQYFQKYYSVQNFLTSKTDEEIRQFLENLKQKAWNIYQNDEYEKYKAINNTNLYDSIGRRLIIDLVKEGVFYLNLNQDILPFDPNFVLKTEELATKIEDKNSDTISETFDNEQSQPELKNNEPEQKTNPNLEFTVPNLVNNENKNDNIKIQTVKSIFDKENIPIIKF